MSLWGKRTGQSLTIESRNGFIVPIDQPDMMCSQLNIDLQILVGLDPDVELLDEEGDDNKPMLRRLRNRLGGLDSSTMYGCVPIPELGGSFTPRGMQIVNAVDHVRFLSTVTPRQVMNWKF
ncbi:T6SS immunity protein Tdi1 domain-containing protein [Nocardia neocaledoniensis]|uniref:T6SS immunity protein Tdi1 domain-containing protein n=1 Tax=Nocardia neocaledoniensis TaxID=236511 RepID=UPI0033E86346